MERDNYIYLATTKGCHACAIMTNIVIQTCCCEPYVASVRIRDIKKIPAWIKENVPFNDFPTLVFIQDDVIKYHCTGTITANKLKQIIKDLDFK